MTHAVADNVLGKIARQQNDLFRRIREGSLNPAIVSVQLQEAIQGNFTITQIPPWIVVYQRRMGGAYKLDQALERKGKYCFPNTNPLSISVGSDDWDITLTRLRSSDLKAKGKDACEVCERAQDLGLTLCHPEAILHLCLQYDMKRGEHFVVPLYGFSSTSREPGQCADFLYKPSTSNKGRHCVMNNQPKQCGLGADVEWVFQLKKEWNSAPIPPKQKTLPEPTQQRSEAHGMTEERFAKLTKGIDLCDKQIALLRKSFGLSYDNTVDDEVPVMQRYLLQNAILKLTQPTSK